jgi:hypothetical protein
VKPSKADFADVLDEIARAVEVQMRRSEN